MTCSSCNSEVGNQDNYCTNCGNSLDFGKRDKSQSLLFAAIAVLFGSAIYWFFIDMIVKLTGKYEVYDTLEWFSNLVSFSASSVALLVALSMKRGGLKTLALVFAIVYTVIQLYWLLMRLLPEKPFTYFEF